MVSYYTHTITVREIVDAVPDTIFVTIPDEWFAPVPKGKGVYDAFYEYIAEKYDVPDRWAPLHQVYVGDVIDEKLKGLVQKKIKIEHKLKGKKLEETASWWDLSSGPQRLIHTWMRVVGPDAVILLDTEHDSPQHKAISALWWERLQFRNAEIARKAKGNSFYSWLMSNIGREDSIGDIAGDIKDDKRFSSSMTNYHEAKLCLEDMGYCDAAINSMRAAWVEYTQKYPERFRPIPICSYCNNMISNLSSAIVAFPMLSDPCEIYHPLCFGDKASEDYEYNYDADDGEYEYDAIYTDVGEKSIQDLISFAVDGFSARYGKRLDEGEMLRYYGDDIKERRDELLFAGIPESCSRSKLKRENSDASKPTVYFIQTDRDDCVKIGYTSSLASRLRAYATHSSVEPRLLFSFPGDKSTEQVLHKRFEHLRIEGKREWFRLDAEILAYIDTLQHERRKS